MKPDIENREDIERLVNTFYDSVREDVLIGPIFKHVIQDNWPVHLDKMYRFWETVVLDAGSYRGSPFLPHATLPITSTHFEVWLQLFNTTIDNLFAGIKANKAKKQAQTMAILFQSKLAYYKDNNIKPLM
jgi:hemoglobin